MFHEMLHVRYPVEQRGAWRCIHMPQFNEAERKFGKFQEARELLKALAKEF